MNLLRLLLPGLPIVLFAVLLAPGVGNLGFRWDESFGESVAWRTEAARLALTGEFPFFTHRAYGGMALFSVPNTGVLYPPNWLYLVFPPWIWNFLLFGHVVAGGLGMFVYLRSHRLLVPVAAVGSFLFLGQQLLPVHSAHIPLQETALLAPWVVLAARWLLRAPGPRGAAALAVALAFQQAAGYQQLFLYTVLWMGVEWLAALLRPGSRRLAATAWLATAGVLGVLLLAVQTIATLDHAALTHRGDHALGDVLVGSFPPAHLVTFFSPRALGAGGVYIGSGPPSEVLALIHPLGWVLALSAVGVAVALPRWRTGGRARTALLFLAGSLAALLLAFGGEHPLVPAIIDLPPFRLFRIPARILFLANGLAVVAGCLALQGLMRVNLRGRLLILGGALFFLGGTTLGAFAIDQSTLPHPAARGASLLEVAATGAWAPDEATILRLAEDGFGPAVPWLLAPASALAGLLLLLALATVGRRALQTLAWAAVPVLALEVHLLVVMALFEPAPYRQMDVFNHTEVFRAAGVADSNDRFFGLHPAIDAFPTSGYALASNLYTGQLSLGGCSPMNPGRLRHLLGIDGYGTGLLDGEFYTNPSAFRHLAVRWIAVDVHRLSPEREPLYGRFAADQATLVAEDGYRALHELRGTRPRFDWARRWRPAEPPELDHHVHANDPASTATITIVEDFLWREMPPALEDLPAPALEVLRDGGSLQRVRVASSATGAVLLVRDLYWPGWKYRLRPAGDTDAPFSPWEDVDRANGLVRYVPVPAGEWIVEMRYRPPRFEEGLALSLAALAITLALAFLPARIPPLRRHPRGPIRNTPHPESSSP